MVFFPRLSTAILLGLTLSSFAHSATFSCSDQEVAAPQTGAPQPEQTSLKSDEAKATEPNQPDQNGTYRIEGNVVAPNAIYSVKPKIAKEDRKLALLSSS